MSKQSMINQSTRTIRGRIVRDAVRRFPNLPTLTLAKYVNERYGTYFENDLEAIRANIRYYRGQLGKKNRKAAKDKHLFTDKVALPPTWRGIKTDYKLKEGLWFVISDIHVPFHEPKAIESAFSAAQAEKVDGVLINGDLQDCSALSYWLTANRDFNAEVELVIDFLDFLRQEFPKQQIVYKPGNHECFDTETEILTKRGWIKGINLLETDNVATLNINTFEIEYQRPLKITTYPYSGQMIRITGTRTDLKVTPNHRLLFRPSGSGKNGKWRISELGDIHTGKNRIALPMAGITRRKDYQMISDDEIKIAAWILTDGNIRRRGSTGNGIRNRKINFPARYTIYQSEKKVKSITDILDRLEWKYSISKERRITKAICGKKLKTKPLASYCIYLIGEANNLAEVIVPTKDKLPDWVNKLSNRQFTLFLSSVVDGDGSRHPSAPKTSWMVYGTKSFLDQLQGAALQYGYRTSISEYRPDTWRLNINPGYVTHLDNFAWHITKETYMDQVWCATVPNDTLVVRRNGKVTITGNSRLPRYYITHAPELADSPLACMETLLGFEERKIEFLDYFQKVMAGMLPIIHGHEIRAISRAVNPARGLYLKAKTFCACSHCHTPSMHSAKDIHGNLLTTWSFGCLCDLEPDWNPFGNDWGWGFAFVNIEKDGSFEVVNRRILPNGSVV